MSKKIMLALVAITVLVGGFLFPQAIRAEEIQWAVSAAFCSERGIPTYQELAGYIGAKVGKSIKIVSGMSYDTIIRLLTSNKIQSAFVCGYSYTLKKDVANLELIVAPVMAAPQYGGRPWYISYVIVPIDSPARTFSDLKGKTYLFSDPQSNSGYNVPRAELAKMGYTIKEFFKDVKFSGAHEKSLEMVAKKQADGASIDSLVWDYDDAFFPQFTSKTKIIASHAAGGIPPLVGPKNLDPALKDALKKAFTGMTEDAEGRRILKKLLLSKFVEVDDSNYDDIRANERLGLDFERSKKR